MKRTRHIFNNKYIIFYKMVTNTITIVAIIVMSLSIVSTSVVFGESQEYNSRSQEDVTFEDIPRDNSDYDQDEEDYDQYLRTQSHGLIKIRILEF